MKQKNTRLELCEASGPLKNLLDNLSGDDGEFWLRALKKTLRKENPFVPEFKIWKTIEVGTFENFSLLEQALKLKVGRIADGGINRKVQGRGKVNLVNVMVEDLGLGYANYDMILRQAKLLGLSLCSTETAFQLRLQYENFPQGENSLIMMEPFKSYGKKTIFRIDSSGLARRAVEYEAGSDPNFRAKEKLVFSILN